MVIMKIMERAMIRPIVSIDQMIANIQRYNEDLATVADRLPYARAWYALRVGKGWLFGPSKFIGYQGLSAKTYIERDKEKMPLDGRVTESILQQWSDLVENGDPRHNQLHTALNELCARFGKKPNSLTRISVIRTGDQSAEAPSSDELVALLAAVFRGLTPAQKSVFRKLVA
jgi:hypothetical protein